MNYDKKNLVTGVYVIALFLVVGVGFLILGNDMQLLLRWNLGIFLLGLCFLPLNNCILDQFGKMRYFFSRLVGLAFVSYIVWLFSRFRLMPFGRTGIYCSILCIILIVVAFSTYKWHKNKSGDEISLFLWYFRTDFETIVSIETIVLLIHVLTTFLLGLKIPANGTERLMDLAYMISIDKAEYMAPMDMWASGCKINYYYFGQYMMTFLSKMTFVDVRYGYSLALSYIMTICIIGVFILVYKLLVSKDEMPKRVAALGGIIGTMAVSFAGNGHYIVFYRIVPMLRTLLQLPENESSYWFPDSTRYIGYIPENTSDRTISEFPFYSYLIGDLHAHVIDIVLVLLIIAIVINYCYCRDEVKCFKTEAGIKTTAFDIMSNILNKDIILLGILLGIASMTNYWDYLIYFVAAGSLILFANFRCFKPTYLALAFTLLQGAVVYIVSSVINIPFMIQFEKMINGIGIVNNRSYFHQLAILWGLPIAVVIILLIRIFSEMIFRKTKLSLSDGLVMMIGLCAVGLVFVPEFIFVKDIYIEGAPRANTMFKLTYQAFILFGIAIGYTFARFIASYIDETGKKDIVCDSRIFMYRKIPLFCIFIWILTMGYPFTAVRMWMGEYNMLSYKGLDAAETILDSVPEEKMALSFINDSIDKNDIILTTYGDSYSNTCIIPALSGNPTVLGWITHEWLWHNGYDFCERRENDINELYEGNDFELKRDLCEKYNLDYIYIGSAERERFPDVNIALIQELGDIVYYNNDYGTYIIKVK